MSDTSAGARRHPAALRAITALTLLTFGCATVRVPASTIGETIPLHDGVADPQLELWIESGGAVSPVEQAEVTGQAHAALAGAVAGRSSPDGDAILVVRAQGVTRTGSRRGNQKAAVAGLVVGAVVVVAVVVAAVIASKGRGGGGGARSAPRASGATRGGAVRSAGIRPSPGRVAAARPGAVRPAPLPAPPRHAAGAPHAHGGGVSVGVGVNVDLWAPPYAAAPLPAERLPPPPPDDAAPPPSGEAWELAPDAPGPLEAVWMPPPPPLPVDGRGFFAGDTLVLELVLVDRVTGAPLWSKVVEKGVDPRDARAVRSVVDAAFSEPGGWIAAQ
jgi:hypothetical protein